MKIKRKLFDLCGAYVAQRIDTAKKAILAAQSSANEETKSSAGDKYETGRAMMQLEIEKNSVQLMEAMKLRQVLDQIDPDEEADTVKLGSVVFTDHENFFIAVSAGQFMLNEKKYFSISPTSPIGMQMMHKKAKAAVAFNKKVYTIIQVM